jgi:hypothetical protein
MKLEKKHWIIIGVVVAIILVWYFFLRKKKTESNYGGPKGGRGTGTGTGTGTLPTNPNPQMAKAGTGNVGVKTGGVASTLPPCIKGPNGVTNAPCTEKKADGTTNTRF